MATPVKTGTTVSRPERLEPSRLVAMRPPLPEAEQLVKSAKAAAVVVVQRSPAPAIPVQAVALAAVAVVPAWERRADKAVAAASVWSALARSCNSRKSPLQLPSAVKVELAETV